MVPMSLDLIYDASKFLQGKIRRTPLEFSPQLSGILDAPVYLKLESNQITGSFKARGALFRAAQLTPQERKSGIFTCTTGNHGLGVAYAASQANIATTIYVPSNIDAVKYQGMTKLGATVIKASTPGSEGLRAFALDQAAGTEAIYLPSFEDPHVMAANGGSIAVEVLEDLPEATNFILPVGGGGLSAGFSYYTKDKIPHCKMIGCQLQASPGLKLSLEKGEAITTLPATETIAAGIEGGIGEQCFEILKTRTDQVVLANEQDVINGVKWILDNHQYLIEPSAAIVIATILNGSIKKMTGSTVIVISGRNVGMKTIAQIIRS